MTSNASHTTMETIYSLRVAFEDALSNFGAKVNDRKDSLDKAETAPWHEVIDHISTALLESKAATEQTEGGTKSYEDLRDACQSVEPSQSEVANSIIDRSVQDMSVRHQKRLKLDGRLEKRYEEAKSLARKIPGFLQMVDGATAIGEEDTSQAAEQTTTEADSE